MIQSLHSLTLSVPDLEVGKDFYTCMGLNARLEGEAYVFRCEEKWLRLSEQIYPKR